MEGRLGFPRLQHAVDHHAIVVGGVSVTVGIPVALPQVNFHVSAHQPHTLNVQQGIAKVRSGGRTVAPRVQDTNAATRPGAELDLTGGAPFP